MRSSNRREQRVAEKLPRAGILIVARSGEAAAIRLQAPLERIAVKALAQLCRGA
jgi:hypothetical protein